VKNPIAMVILTTGSLLLPASAVGQTLYTQCNVWYDEAANVVTANATTYVEYNISAYYMPWISVELLEGNVYVAQSSVPAIYGTASVSVPAHPNTDYVAHGFAYVQSVFSYFVYPDPSWCIYDPVACYFGGFTPYWIYYDPFYFYYWGGFCNGFRSVSCLGIGPPIWITAIMTYLASYAWDTVHVPPPKYFQATGSNQKNPCQPGDGSGVGAAVHYQVLDNTGMDMQVAGIAPLEHVVRNGQDYTQGFNPFSPATDSSGTFNDDPVGSCFLNVPPGQNPCVDVVQTFQAVLDGATYIVPTTVTRRDCLNGIRIQVTGNPAGKNYSKTYGTVPD
jgi:hypothetical protein